MPLCKCEESTSEEKAGWKGLRKVVIVIIMIIFTVIVITIIINIQSELG